MIRIQRWFSFLISKWRQLFKIESVTAEPGFIGSIPHLLLLRWFVLCGIWLRFALHRGEYTVGEWSLIQSLIGVMGVLAITVTYVTTRPALRRSKRVQAIFIASDILLVSIFYYWTKNTQSDFFLFYYLPILTATEYLGRVAILAVPTAITCAFISVLALLLPKDPDPTLTFGSLVSRVFLPREIFFLSIVMLSSYLRQLERTQKDRLSQREAEVRALLYFRSEVEQLFDVDQVLERTVRRATEIVGAVGGHLSLVNYETRQLELRSCTLQGYFREKPPLTMWDTLARQVVQERRPQRLNNVHTDPVLSGIFDPRVHSLLCVPIMAHNTVLGILSVGSRTDDHFGDGTEGFLRALVDQAASTIERARLLTALGEIGSATGSTLELDAELDAILHEITDKLAFEFATVSLVDDYRQVVEAIRGKNVPPGWIERSRHKLDSPDITAHIVRTGETKVIEGWDEDLLDREIYERFGHANLARVWAPIVADGAVVGVIEAGCRREYRAATLAPENVRAVERLGQERGTVIARIRPHVLLELIANRAIEIIGADSASIHVYRSDHLLLEAGAGRATKDFLLKFPPRKEGIGRYSIQTGELVVIDKPEELAVRRSDLYAEGIRAIAAFPLSLDASVHGVLYVHFWREHQFSQAELELEKVFARQMEIAIQNNLLLRNISEAAQRAWMLPGLQNIIQSLALASNLNLTQVLEDVAQNVLYMLGADNVTLYQYFQESRQFESPPVMKGSFRDEAFMQAPIDPNAVVWKIVQDGQTRFIPDVSSDLVLSGVRSNGVDRPRFVDREGVRSSAAVVLKTGETDEIVGLMFVNYRTPHEFSAEDRRTINALASSAAIAIKTARLYERVSRQLQRRDKELEALRAVDRAIVSGVRAPDLQLVLEFILEKGMEIAGAPVGALMWFDRWENALKSKAQRGLPEGHDMIRQKVGEGIVGLAAQKRVPILVHDVRAGEWARIYEEVVPDTRSELAVPLVDESGLLGVLNVEHPEVGAFSDDDLALLETLAVQAIIAIHSVDLYQKLGRQIQSLRSLSAIATRIQDARYDLDTVLRLLLTGVTAGEGLGFSRAMLFLTDEAGAQLQGKMAIGAQTREEAEAIWKSLDARTNRLMAEGKSILTYLLDQAETFSTLVTEKRRRDWPLSRAIKGICIPIEQGAGALSACVLEGKTVVIESGQPDPFRRLIEQISRPGDGGRAFACAPLVGRGKTIGVLVVDNRFLISEGEIEEGTLNCLEAFAGVMAMSVENTQLQARLAAEQRTATWREFTAQTAHIIGTRIAVIGGALTELRSHLLDNEAVKPGFLGETRALLGELAGGIRKAQIALEEFRQYAAPLELRLAELDLANMLKATIQEVQPSVDCLIEPILPSAPIVLQGDSLRLSHAFIELVRNAQEAMQQAHVKAPRVTIAVTVEVPPSVPLPGARIEFADTGPGIPEADKVHLFEPFFSRKGWGSGLGLAIVKKIIEQHKGTIDEIGTPGTGARFIIRLPILRYGVCLKQEGGGGGDDQNSRSRR